jgi:UDP-N-acetylmuramate--alanine ligase
MTKEEKIVDRQTLTSLEGIRAVYLIGIGGIGMSAVARYFLSRGMSVSGYDRTETDLTKALVQEGMSISYKDEDKDLPQVDLVVYTPAVPKDQAALVYYREHNYRVVKRSDVLQAISAGSFNICVGGTHGKTTISTLIAHILRHSGYGCNAFLGGISVNYHTNFWSSERNTAVIEADEYDRSFLKLSPDIAVITSMDADHLDIYGDERSLQDAFVGFGNRLKEGGLLISKFGLKRIGEVKAGRKLTYSVQNDAADVFTRNIKMENGGYTYDVLNGEKELNGVSLRIGGMHNVENSLVAVAVAQSLQIDDDKIKAALADFKGVKRRFEYIVPPRPKEEGAYVQPVLIDDYAHHPEELRALLTSVRSLFPQRRITVIFQPHLFSRTRDLADGFAASLSLADRVLLLPIYPAREQPLPGVTSQLILDKVSTEDRLLLTKEELLNWMSAHVQHLDKTFGEVIVMAGAGDIDALVAPVEILIKKAW